MTARVSYLNALGVRTDREVDDLQLEEACVTWREEDGEVEVVIPWHRILGVVRPALYKPRPFGQQYP